MKPIKHRTIDVESFLRDAKLRAEGKKKDELTKDEADELAEAKSDSDNDKKISDDKHQGKYSLRTKIIKNPWLSKNAPNEARKWMYHHVFKHPEIYRYDKSIMFQGGLFMFEYFEPKYKGTNVLPWFDQFPMVVSLGGTKTKLGVRNLGFNLHLLPINIRIIVLCAIFELHKKLYRYQIFYKHDKPIGIHYYKIVKALEKYGVKFCVRMYIPNLQNKIVRFPIKEWHNAVFIPSFGYDGIRAEKLIREWGKYCEKHGHSKNQNIDWQKII